MKLSDLKPSYPSGNLPDGYISIPTGGFYRKGEFGFGSTSVGYFWDWDTNTCYKITDMTKDENGINIFFVGADGLERVHNVMPGMRVFVYLDLDSVRTESEE